MIFINPLDLERKKRGLEFPSEPSTPQKKKKILSFTPGNKDEIHGSWPPNLTSQLLPEPKHSKFRTRSKCTSGPTSPLPLRFTFCFSLRGIPAIASRSLKTESQTASPRRRKLLDYNNGTDYLIFLSPWGCKNVLTSARMPLNLEPTQQSPAPLHLKEKKN